MAINGAGADAAITIGTTAVAHTITVGNVTGATAVNVNSGTGGYTNTTTGAGDFTVASGDDVAINGAGADAAITIGTTAVAHTITVGNVTGATKITLNTGTGGLDTLSGTGTVVTNAVTINTDSGVITDDGTDINLDTTRADITLTNSHIAATSVVMLTICSAGMQMRDLLSLQPRAQDQQRYLSGMREQQITPQQI